MKRVKEKFYMLFSEKPIRTCIVISLLLTLIIELLSKRSFIKFGLFLIQKPHILLLNAGIILWSFSFLLITRRKLFLAALLSIIWLALGVVDFVLLCFRVTPFNFSDLRLTKDAVLVAGKYLKWYHLVLLAVGMVLLLFLLIKLFKKLPKEGKEVKLHPIRGALLIFCFLLSIVGISSVYINDGLIESSFGNLAEAYQEYGFVYCFANSVINIGVKKPENYDESIVEEISDIKSEPESKTDTVTVLEGRQDVVDDTGIELSNETPNIIFVQLESFCNPMLWNFCNVSEDPIPNFHKLMQDYSSGYVSVPSVGAGTANTEFESITGMNLDLFGPGEYPYKTVLREETCESMAYNMKEIGYHAHAIHNNMGTFYDRYKVFSMLGFETFTSIEYMRDYDTTYMGWPKDKILTSQIEQVLSSTRGADYIYTISVQGHGSYPTEKVIEDPAIHVTGLEDEELTNQLEYYITQISEMDEFVRDLVDMLTERGEPTILVMYGDHLPSLGLTDEKLTNGDEFQTEYVIWDNLGLERTTRDVEAYQLAAYVQAKIGLSQGTMFRYHQPYLERIVHSKSEDEQYLNDMQVLEYDMLYGDKDVYNGESPYEPTKLHYGISDIRILSSVMTGDDLYLFGCNFTPSSVIVINGKKAEMGSGTGNMIYALNVELEEGENEITVEQISDDNITLSSSNTYIITKENNEKQ